MKFLVCLTFFITALASTSLVGVEDQISSDHKRLIGSWEVLRDTPSPASGAHISIMKFTTSELIYRSGIYGREMKEDGPIHYEVDITKSPMWITLSGKGEDKFEQKGIYRFVDGQLQIVWRFLSLSKDRPMSFDQLEQNVTLIRATRIEPDKEAEQGGADQPATAPELKSEAKDKPQPESKVRPR